MASKGLEYASVLMGYPASAFFMLKLAAYLFHFTPPSWVFLAVILIAHVFSLIYIVKGMDSSK
jgi:hypothetical protein